MNLPGLSQLNIELTSRCSKHTKCFMCGHQSERVNPNLRFGDMAFDLLMAIRDQLEPPVVISFHRDGDPLDYPKLRNALKLFAAFPTSIVTHGERLAERAAEIIGLASTVTVSIIPNDPDRELQYESIFTFLEIKGNKRPNLQLKFVGAIENPQPYYALDVPIIGRRLHSLKGDWNYVENNPPRPEIGVCLDFLGRPTVDWQGRLFICNRLDVHDHGLLGDLNTHTLEQLWNGPARAQMLQHHLAMNRAEASPLCATCKFWGIPAA